MRLPSIVAADVVKNGLVVTYADATTAFYHESVLHAHLRAEAAETPRKRPQRVGLTVLREQLSDSGR